MSIFKLLQLQEATLVWTVAGSIYKKFLVFLAVKRIVTAEGKSTVLKIVFLEKSQVHWINLKLH